MNFTSKNELSAPSTVTQWVRNRVTTTGASTRMGDGSTMHWDTQTLAVNSTDLAYKWKLR